MTPATILLRQVHPSFLSDGQLSSQAFIPFPKDEGLLSVHDGDQVSAADAHAHFTGILHFLSAGVWGVTNGEVSGVGLTSRDDAQHDFLFHAVIDFGTLTGNECRKLAKRLRAFAVARGCLFAAAE